MENQMDTLEGELDTLEGKVDAIEMKVDEVEGKVDVLKELVDQYLSKTGNRIQRLSMTRHNKVSIPIWRFLILQAMNSFIFIVDSNISAAM